MDKEQQRQYRKFRASLGYKRIELIAHKDDHKAIKAAAQRLERRRRRIGEDETKERLLARIRAAEAKT